MAVALLAGALAMAGAASTRSSSGQLVAPPPIVAVCAALAALTSPAVSGEDEARRMDASAARSRRGCPA